jgi:hypothetical protein
MSASRGADRSPLAFRWLSDIRPVDPDEAARCVFKVLSRHVDPGQIAKVREALPRSLRQSWEAAAAVEPV